MAEITRRRSGELVRGVFQILSQQVDAVPAKEVLRRLEGLVPPSEFEASTYPNRPTVRRYEKIVRFSTIGAVKAGWLIKNKGAWSLTDDGRAAFGRFKDPEAFYREAGRLYRAWKADQPADREAEEEEESGEAATTLEETGIGMVRNRDVPREDESLRLSGTGRRAPARHGVLRGVGITPRA